VDFEQLESELPSFVSRPWIKRFPISSAPARGAARYDAQIIIVGCMHPRRGLMAHQRMGHGACHHRFSSPGAGAATGGVLRGHLIFTEYLNRRNLPTERHHARALVIVDVLWALRSSAMRSC
jgi:hypothetical protein